MDSRILVVLVAFVFTSGILALPNGFPNGRPNHDMLILTQPSHQAADVLSPDFDILVEQYRKSTGRSFDVLWSASEEVYYFLEGNGASAGVIKQTGNLFNSAAIEMLNIVTDVHDVFNPNDPLEDTALLIDNTLVQLNLLLVKYGTTIEEIVAKDAADLLSAIKEINKRTAENVAQEIEPLIAMVREILKSKLNELKVK